MTERKNTKNNLGITARNNNDFNTVYSKKTAFPPFSVSMCVYAGDKPEWFNAALESIVNQTVPPDEIVLVVDGSISKELDDVIINFQKKHEMKVIRFTENRGHGAARAEGFAHCSYDLIAVADADDISAGDRFEKQLKAFTANPALSAVSSGSRSFIDSTADIVHEELLPANDKDIKRMMKTRCAICQPSVMLKKDAVIAAGGYKDWYCAEDYYLWIRMMQNGAVFGNIPEYLLYFRTSNAQMKRRGGLKYFKSMEKLFRYMLKNKIIGFFTYLYNVSGRFVIQVLMPPKLRGFVRRKLT